MKSIFIIRSIIIIQLVFIITLIFYIYNKQNSFNIKANISPIDKSTIQKTNTNNLKSMWEMPHNQTVTFSANFLKKPITYRFNDDSLNETQNYPIEKSPNTYRIITLGDSFTFGSYVQTKDNWTEILEKKLNEKPICKNINKFEIINLGVAGYDPQYEVASYKNKGQKYNPDLILWMLIQPDRINEFTIPLLNECTKGQSSISMNKKEREKFSKCVNDSENNLKQKYTAEQIYTIQSDNVNKITQFYNKKIIFIDFWNNHQPILAKLKNINFSLINTHQEFANKITNQYLLFPDGHPTEKGHQIIAYTIFKQLFDTNQIPCESLR